MTTPCPPHHSWVKTSPLSWNVLLIKGLALEPGRRWRDAGQLKAALEAGLPEKRLEKRRRRRKTGACAAAAILLALCLAAGLRTLLKAQNPLYGMETESFFFYTRDEVSEIPAERQMQLLAQEAEALTGGLYILKQSGEGCLLTVPADCLEEEGLAPRWRPYLKTPGLAVISAAASYRM